MREAVLETCMRALDSMGMLSADMEEDAEVRAVQHHGCAVTHLMVHLKEQIVL